MVSIDDLANERVAVKADGTVSVDGVEYDASQGMTRRESFGPILAMFGMAATVPLWLPSVGEAADCDKKMTIESLYDAAQELANPEYPDATKLAMWSDVGLCEYHSIKTVSGREKDAISWRVKDNFRKDYFESRESPKLKSVMAEYGVDIPKFEVLVGDVSDRIGVGMFNSGFVAVYDNRNVRTFVFPTEPKIAKAVGNRVYKMRI